MTKVQKNKILHHLNFLKSIGYEYHESLKLFNKEINVSSLPNDLKSLKEICENCFLCELSKSRKNVLFGEGNTQAQLMIITDQPTASEDELKSFFVGKNGEQLAKMIESVLPLKKEDVFITSLVKCKSNDSQIGSAFNSCNSYLYKQIELIQPKLIVTMGEVAYKYLTNDNSAFNLIRGKQTYFKHYRVIPTFAVSFLLRNPSLKKEAYVDLLKIKYILESN